MDHDNTLQTRNESVKTSVNKTRGRDPLWDNIRGLLIILVVCGHMIEACPLCPSVQELHRIIYAFHMPAFIFVSGFFARFRPARLLRSTILPYLVFQPLYLLFATRVLKQFDAFDLQYTTPYWHLWYLVAISIYHSMIPFLEEARNPLQRILVLLVVCCASVIVGYDSTINTYLTLSRVVVFAPFYVAGFYLSRRRDSMHKRSVLLGIASLVLTTLLLYYQLHGHNYEPTVLYGVAQYGEGYGPLRRVRLLMQGFSWIALLVAWMPRRHVPFLTTIGERTLPIFLLHGFIARYVTFKFLGPVNTLLALAYVTALTALTLACFGNGVVSSVFSLLFVPKKKERKTGARHARHIATPRQ